VLKVIKARASLQTVMKYLSFGIFGKQTKRGKITKSSVMGKILGFINCFAADQKKP
jgi:hypothetical protein